MLPQVDATGLLLLVVLVVLFFVFRFVLLWYWRINEAIDLLKQIEQNTRPTAPPSAVAPGQPNTQARSIPFAPRRRTTE